MATKENVIRFRVSDKEREEIRRSAITLGFVNFDGTANISAYMRAAHRLARQMKRDGMLATNHADIRILP